MLKRIGAVILAIVLITGSLSAAMAAGYDNLWDKLINQIVMGSALELEFSFASTPNSLLSQLGLSLNGSSGTATYVHDQKNHNLYELKGALGKNEAAVKSFTLNGDDSAHVLTASWLDKPLRLSREMLTQLLTTDRDETKIVEALFAAEDEKWADKVAKAGDSYRLELETWLAQYAQISDVVDGSMTIRYTIPAEALKTEIKTLFDALMKDSAMLKLLAEKLPPEMAERYLDTRWASQYAGILETMPLEGELVITRVQNVMGEVESTHLSLPIPSALAEWGHTLTYQVDELNWHVGLMGEENTFIFTWNKQAQADTAAGQLMVEVKDHFKVKVGFDCSWSTKEWVDEKEREHESLMIQMNLTDLHQNEEGYLAFEPIKLTYEDELRSKNTNVSATYIKKGLVTLAMGNETDTLNFIGQSASPWKVNPNNSQDGQNIETVEDLVAKGLGCLISFFQ